MLESVNICEIRKEGLAAMEKELLSEIIKGHVFRLN